MQVNEDDVLFEAQGVWTEARCIAFQKLALRTARMAGFALCLLALVPIARLAMIGAYIEAVICAAIYFSIFMLLLRRPYRFGKRMYQYYQAVCGCESAFRFVFLENGVADINLISGAREDISYARIQKISKRKTWYFLHLGEKLYLAFRPDELTKGDAAAFEAFIKEKCPNAKRNF